MRDYLKKLYFWYQRLQFYAAQSESEYVKASRFLNTSLLLGIFAKQAGFNITWKVIILFNLLMLIIAVVLGKFLVDLGVTRLNSRLNNQQSPELMQILTSVEKLEKELLKNEKTYVK